MKAPNAYDAAFFENQKEESLKSARVIVPIVLSLVRPTSVVDFGCGIGAWLAAFKENGVDDYLGLDGDYVAPEQLLIDRDRFRAVNLSEDIPDLGRPFDLAVCLEVGEHLPARVAPRLVERLTAAAPCVLFSAAVPGQTGTHHVNERWPSYWQQMFAERGYVRLDPIRPRVWRDATVEWWFKQNIFVYVRSDVIAAQPSLQQEAEIAAKCQFELVHVDALGKFATSGGLLRALPVALSRTFSRMLLGR